MTNQPLPKMELIKDEEIHDIFDSIDGINSILCGEKCAQAQLSACEKVHTLALQEKDKIIIELQAKLDTIEANKEHYYTQATLEKQLKQEREKVLKEIQDAYETKDGDIVIPKNNWNQYLGGK